MSFDSSSAAAYSLRYLLSDLTHILQPSVIRSAIVLSDSFILSFIFAKILDKAMGGIRVDEAEEVGGLDTNLHEESAYNFN